MVVDTSIWIDYFKERKLQKVEQLTKLLNESDCVVMGDLVLMEVLQGIRFKRESKRIHAEFEVLEIKGLVGEEIARCAAEYVRQLRSQGITIRNTIDCLIATWCIENDVPLLHADKDFEYFIQFGLIEA